VVNLRQRIRFYQQLAVLTRAGVPLRTGLARMHERLKGKEIAALNAGVAQGEPLGAAFIAAGFSPFESNLVAAGERSAQLEIVLQHLAEFWTHQRQMFQALTGQLYYPLIVLVLSFVVGSIIELMVASPLVVIIHLVETLATYGAIGFVLFTLVRVSWSSDAAQRFWLAVPLIGRTLSTAYAYRWITALRLEYSAGIPMPDAVADAWRASGYASREALAQEGQLALREGEQLSTLVQRWRRLPRDWVDFVETGELSGALDAAFANLEAEAARSWDTAQRQMTNWLPKIIYFIALLVVGAQVYFLVSGVYQREVLGPMNEINSILGQ
jgi:type II secretory pathway component PulF